MLDHFFWAAAFSFALDGGKHQALSYEHPVADGYMLWIPEGCSEDKVWLVILSLHSAAEVDGPVENALDPGPSAGIVSHQEDTYEFLRDEFINISPHMKEGAYEERQKYLYKDILNNIIEKVQEEYNADEKRIYSTTATGVCGYLSRYPSQFTAAAAKRLESYGAEPLLCHKMDDRSGSVESSWIVKRSRY